jgi:hypothetical protein
MGREAVLTPMVGRHNSRGPVRTWSMRAGDLVLIGAVINFAYAAAIIHALARPDSRIAPWVDAWVRIARSALKPAYLLAAGPDCGGTVRGPGIDQAWAFDVHLTTINLLVVTLLFALSRPSWPTWGRQVDAADGMHRDDAAEGFGVVLWGAMAALWWMLLQNDLFDTARHCAGLRPWRLFREPALATTVHGLACMAAALGRARAPS